MEQTNKNLQSLYRLSPSDSYLDEPNGRTLGVQVSAQAAAQLGQRALNSARSDKFSSLNFAQNWNIPGFDPSDSPASDELATLSAAALEAYAYGSDYELAPEDYASLMRVRQFVKAQDEARVQTRGTPEAEPAPDNKPRYAIYRSGAVMPLRPNSTPRAVTTQRKELSYGMTQGMAQSVGLECKLEPERYSQYVNVEPTNNATTRITMSAASPRAQALTQAQALPQDTPAAPTPESVSYDAQPFERLAPEHEVIATVVAEAQPEASPDHPAENTTMPNKGKEQPAAEHAPHIESAPRNEVLASSDGVRIVRTLKPTFVPSPDAIIAQHSMTRERWGEYGLKGVGGRPLNTSYPRPDDDFYVPTASSMRPLTVAEAQAALAAARRRQAYGVEDQEPNTDHIDNAVLVRNSTTCIVTNSRKAVLDYEKSAALDAELERQKHEHTPESGDEGPATVISRHAVMQRPVKSAAELLAEAQAQIIAPIADIPDAGWEKAVGHDYVPDARLRVEAPEPKATPEPVANAEVGAAPEVVAVPESSADTVVEPEVAAPVVEAQAEAPVSADNLEREAEKLTQQEAESASVEPVAVAEPALSEPVPAAERAATEPVPEEAEVAATEPEAELAAEVAQPVESSAGAPSAAEPVKGRRSRRNKTRVRARAAAEVKADEAQAIAPQAEPVVAKSEPAPETAERVKAEPQTVVAAPVVAEAEPQAVATAGAKAEAKAEPVKAEAAAPVAPAMDKAAEAPAEAPAAAAAETVAEGGAEGSARRRKRRRR